MTLSKRTAVVISAHRPYATLDSCLRGFCSIVDRAEDLIFVNNGSDESLTRLVSTRFPEITAIHVDQNRLFCAGYNAGIRIALTKHYDFVLIVNADTEVINPAFINELLAAAERWPNAAFFGPMVYYRDCSTVQNTRFRFPSVAHNIATWIPWRLLAASHRQRPLREAEVDFLNGVCVLCRCPALQQIGLMDEAFGGYVEDADWSWRARSHGWISVFVPVPGIIHHEEREGYEHSSFKSFLLKRNTVLWYLKAGYRFSGYSYALAAICLAWFRALLAGSRSARHQHRRFIQALRKSYLDMLFGNQSIRESDPAVFAEKGRLRIWQ
jgi:N-acetylglucosaminyl-diphospho-decaprenol L-rhamnosyltransferase